MPTYNITGKTYNAVPLTEFQIAKVSLNLNAPNSMTFSKPCKFDATSISNLQKDVSINYATKTLFTGKTKEIQQNLGAGDEHHEYSVIGANLEETYAQQISGEIVPLIGKAIWSNNIIYIANENIFEVNTNRVYIYGDIHSPISIFLTAGLNYLEVYGNIFAPGIIFGFVPAITTVEILGNLYGSTTIYLEKATVTTTNDYTQFLALFSNSILNINKDLYYSDKFIESGSTLNVGGNELPYIMPEVPQDPPSMDTSYYENNAQPPFKFIGGATTVLSGIYEPPNGIIYSDGDVVIMGAKIYGCLVVAGTITVPPGSYLEQYKCVSNRNLPALVAKNIDIEGFETVINGLIYVYEHILIYDSDLNLKGALISNMPSAPYPEFGIFLGFFDNLDGSVNIEYEDYSSVPGLIY